jgi:hypothetical protein
VSIQHLRPLLPFLALAALGAGEAAQPFPWKETFTMPLDGGERTFVVHRGGSWMLVGRSDLSDGKLLAGSKDVALESKIERTPGGGLRLPGLEQVEIAGDQVLWRTRVDGDNLYLFGQLSGLPGNRARLVVAAVESAPSDLHRIGRRLAEAGKEDWPARLKAATWIRDQAAVQPNKEFWLNAADEELGRVIADAAAIADAKRDLALLDQVVSWCVDLARDPSKAGAVCSQAWVAGDETPRGQELRRRLRRLGLEAYQGRWMPRPEALAAQFDQRFAALTWTDAEGFFRLGRWADVNAEFLPTAKDRAYRCYQAGLRANPRHQGILNALGASASVAQFENAGTRTGNPGQAPASPEENPPAEGAATPGEGGPQRPNEVELSPLGFRLAERNRDGISAWIKPPRADKEGDQVAIELLFWNDLDQDANIGYTVEYGGQTYSSFLPVPGKARAPTSLTVPWRADAVPRLDLQQVTR